MMKLAICLLRNDLRVLDNEVLFWAHNNADRIIPLYCFDPRHYEGTYHHGFPKTGPHRLKFLLQSVEDLRANLVKRGSALVVRQGKPEEIVPGLIQQLETDAAKVTSLVLQREATQEETDVEKALQKGLQCYCSVHTVWGSTLVHKDDLPFSTKQLPDVYTQFRKKVEAESQIRPLITMPEKLKPLPGGIDLGEIPTFLSFGQTEVEEDSRSAFPFKGGETTALHRLQYYLWDTNKVGEYKNTRNGMIGHEYSTKFSTWLAHGCISPRQIYWEIKRYEEQRTANQSTYWVIFELLWRDYFRFVALKYGNRLFFSTGLLKKHVAWKKDLQAFNAWKEGKTGVPFVDANMRELAYTGFMSNRGRQNVASFLTKDLKLDWRLGAEWFESNLIDHDVCSNYGNWLYSAGIGNDPRENRKFNMVKQGLDYDSNGDYVRLWVPELSAIKDGSVHVVWTLSPSVLSKAGITLEQTYPKPLVIAPEWARHTKRSASAGAGSGKRGRPQSRGIDFYFRSNSKR